MQELEKILEEIESVFNENVEDIEDENGVHHFVIDSFTATFLTKEIIRKHKNDDNDGWIPCEEPPEIDCRTILIQLKNEGIMEGLYNGSEFVGIDRMGTYQFLKSNPPLYWRRKPEPYRPERRKE